MSPTSCCPTIRRHAERRLVGAAAAAAAIACLALGAPGAKADEHRGPVATLDGEPIPLEAIGPEIAFRLYRLDVDRYSLVKNAVEELVDDRLLAREAARRGTTTNAMLREVEAAAEPATEGDVDAWLADHPEAASEPNARERIAQYLTETRRIQRRLDLLAKLRERADFRLLVEPPEQPRTRVSTEGAPRRGDPAAPVTLVHFATFASARSARSADYIRRLQADLPGQVAWVHRNLPNDRDEIGLAAAQLAKEAQDHDRFWQVHDQLFALGGRITNEDLKRVASDADLRPIEPGRSAYLDEVKNDIDAARRIGVTSEPVIFVNGRYFSPTFPYEKLRALVDEELARSARD